MTEAAISLAEQIHSGFVRYDAAYRALSTLAGQRFCAQDWSGAQGDAERRLDLYGERVGSLIETLDRFTDRADWCAASEPFHSISGRAPNGELARTFFNSVVRRRWSIDGVDPELEFVDDPDPTPSLIPETLLHRFDAALPVRRWLDQILRGERFQADYAQLDSDVALASAKIEAWLRNDYPGATIGAIETLRPIFYRNKGAYLIGRIYVTDRWHPLILALTHGRRGIEVDAVLTRTNDASILFSFARSYFAIDTDRPSALIAFLKSFLPDKPIAELYIALGFHKHGKTELYRYLLRHLNRHSDRFTLAAGDRGMVMLVFALPQVGLVFKVIRDRFDFPKKVTHSEVKHRYELVFRHDRVGRLVDAQEFHQLRLPIDTFDKDLLEEILSEAANCCHRDGDSILFDHLYVERLVTPLNLYLRAAAPSNARRAILDYGASIKQLAAANIFPGDFLLKNFGVTRHGRVVFYDYDELCRLADCRFRRIPVARHPEDEIAAEPWYSVQEADVFPEEFERFLGIPAPLRQIFNTHHGDLFDVHFWREMQARHERGDWINVFPYPQRHRLRPAGL